MEDLQRSDAVLLEARGPILFLGTLSDDVAAKWKNALPHMSRTCALPIRQADFQMQPCAPRFDMIWRCALAAGEKLGHMAALRVMRHDATDNAALLWHPTTNAVCLGSISGVISMEDLNQDARDKRSVNLFLQWRCSQPVDTSLAEETLNQRSVMTTLRHARCHYAERTQACTGSWIPEMQTNQT